jgi:hypothetical protein
VAAATLALALPALAQQRGPYLGYAYPAGGRVGTTFAVKVGGQSITPTLGIEVTGPGVRARVVEDYPRIGAQEITLLREQLKELQAARKKAAAPQAPPTDMMAAAPGEAMAPNPPAADAPPPAAAAGGEDDLIARIENRLRENCDRPACNALVDLVFLEVTLEPDAPPGRRELRLVTPRGVSNPLVFHVGQLPETTRPAMLPASFQVLGKEELSLRKRPAEQERVLVTPPCVMNGQIASGEINRYRFPARRGQRLVLSVAARELIPFIADAVPGWFQPVLTLFDATGREIAYQDDFRFHPDPALLFEVPADGEYEVAIADALHRGREDFLYRLTLAEAPHLTGVFPLGGPVGSRPELVLSGWNLEGAQVEFAPAAGGEGLGSVRVRVGDLWSNPLPFAWDSRPEIRASESSDPSASVPRITLPVVVNGQLETPADQDEFAFEATAGQPVVVEVQARRLGSPLDSLLRVLDPQGAVVALNDDHGDPTDGVHTHHADSYLVFTPAQSGLHRIRIADATRAGGPEFAYRLRVSAPSPDFSLRVAPSSLALRRNQSASLTVFASRRDGYDGPIQIELQNPPPGLQAAPVTLPAGKHSVKWSIKADKSAPETPIDLAVRGSADLGGGLVVQRLATAAEDRMQAFLWRHLVAADHLRVLVFDPDAKPAARPLPPPCPETLAAVQKEPPKFSASQVTGRLRQINQLYQERLLSDAFTAKRIAECQRTEATP